MRQSAQGHADMAREHERSAHAAPFCCQSGRQQSRAGQDSSVPLFCSGPELPQPVRTGRRFAPGNRSGAVCLLRGVRVRGGLLRGGVRCGCFGCGLCRQTFGPALPVRHPNGHKLRLRIHGLLHAHAPVDGRAQEVELLLVVCHDALHPMFMEVPGHLLQGVARLSKLKEGPLEQIVVVRLEPQFAAVPQEAAVQDEKALVGRRS